VHAVLPLTCAASWIADACEQLYPGYRMFGWREVEVLSGIVFDGSCPGDYQMHLSEIRKDDTAGELEFDAAVTSTVNGRDRFHYRAAIALRRTLPEPPLFQTALHAASRPGVAAAMRDLYRDGTLFHGPLFRGVQNIERIDEHGLALRCRLAGFPLSEQGQFPARTINPFVTDSALQSLLIWFRWAKGRASLPLSMVEGQHFGTLHFDRDYTVVVEVRDCTDQRLRADVIAYGEDERVLLRYLGTEVVTSEKLDRFFDEARTRTAVAG
jgi:hypothetical protein